MEYVQVRLVLLASAMNESMWAGHLWRDDDGHLEKNFAEEHRNQSIRGWRQQHRTRPLVAVVLCYGICACEKLIAARIEATANEETCLHGTHAPHFIALDARKHRAGNVKLVERVARPRMANETPHFGGLHSIWCKRRTAR